MAKLGTLCLVLGAIVVDLAVVGFLITHAFACSWVTSGSCPTPWPWELTGEDRRLFVLYPGAVVVPLLGAGIALHIAARVRG